MEKKKKTRKKKTLQTSDKIMLFVFVLLIVIVISLAIVAISKKTQAEKVEYKDLVIPILDKKAKEQIQIDISNMKEKEEKEYVFEVTNYKNKQINQNKLTYHISLSASADVSLTLQEEDKKENLLKDNQATYVFEAKKKEKKTYHLKIKARKEIPENSFVSLEIES